MKRIDIERNLNEETRKQGIAINGKVFSLHITANGEVVVTDNDDYTIIYSVQSLDFYKMLANT